MTSEAACDWPIVTIGELASPDDGAIAIGPFGSSMKAETYTQTGIPVVRGNNLTGRPGFFGDFVFIPEATAAKFSRCLVRPDDLVFPHRGAIGEVGIVAEQGFEQWMLSTSMMKFRPDPKRLNSRFAFYFFRSSLGRHQLLKNASQVGTPGIGQPLASLRASELVLPPIYDQRAIVDVLGALDSKIEQNRRTAQSLERLARAIFQAWFVDFEPVKAKAAGATAFPSMPQPVFDTLPACFIASEIGPVPEGWEVLRLDESLTLQRGFDLPKQSRTDGSHPVFAASGLNGWHSEWKVRGPGVTTGRSGILGQVFFVDRDFWPLNTSLWVKEYKRSNPWHAYFLLQTLELAQFNAGSAVPTLNRNHVHSLPIVAPPDNLMKAFGQTCTSTFSLDQKLRTEVDTLTAMRDYLLPKLLSGDVRVEATHG